jgi:serine/threonine protein phosphatase PrpC
VVGDPRSWLLAGFQTAHTRIQQFGAKYTDLQGMGTTCTAVALLDHQLYYAHIGDSRLYLVRNSSVSRLTHDHSYVTRLVENGIIRAEEAESHPQRHILTAALGAGASVTPDCPPEPISLQSGDQEIRETVTGKTAEESCHALVETAKQRGGPDNITVQVLRVD